MRRSYSAIWSLPFTNITWYSDPWPVKVTSKPIRRSTNFMTLIPSLNFIELRVVSMEHLQWLWHACRERLPFQNLVPSPCLGTGVCSNCWDQFSRTCRVFSQLFTLNTPRYFLDFASERICTTIVCNNTLLLHYVIANTTEKQNTRK